MLPGVNVHERNHSSASSRSIRKLVLVEGLSVINAVRGLVVNEPSPARTLNGSSLADKHGLELIHRPPLLINHVH